MPDERDEYGFQRYVFRLACAYGLAKTAPERKLGEVVPFDEDDKPKKRADWLWNQERKRWRS